MKIKIDNPLMLFLFGFGIFVFTRLSKLVPTIPIAILVSFVFILRFSRTQSPKKGILLTFLGLILAMNIGLFGLFEMETVSSLLFNLLRSSLLAVIYFLPFMIDRVLYPKFKDKAIVSTLVFPIVTTATFLLLTIEGPFEGAIQPSKFVFGTNQFLQLLSVFGVFGFVFFTSWLASAINHLWERDFDWKKAKKMVLILVSVVLAVFLFGTVKIFMTPVKDTVKIAAIIITPEEEVPMETVYIEKLTSPFEQRLAKIEDLIKTAVSNNAKIISFQEFAIIINEKDHDRLKEEFKRLSQENDIFLSISYGYFAKEGKGKNLHLLINNNGEILLDYQKRYLAGMWSFGETRAFEKGPEIIQSVDTPYGKIGISICREMEMAKYIIQAGKAGVDIMISSAYEWPERWTLNSPQRAIENGFSLIRPTYNGITYATDYNGKILNQMHFEETDTGIMYTDIPIKGVRTLYPRVGKLIGWLSTLGLFILIVYTLKRKGRKK